MNTQYLTQPFARHAVKQNIPVTARGRALYTTAWFLNGKPRAVNYDNLIKTTQGALPC